MELTEEERIVLLKAIHQIQDNYAESSDALAGAEDPEDRAMGRRLECENGILDAIRRKLGDEWEPDPGYVAPDTPEGI
jgi:hypothetical protein